MEKFGGTKDINEHVRNDDYIFQGFCPKRRISWQIPVSAGCLSCRIDRRTKKPYASVNFLNAGLQKFCNRRDLLLFLRESGHFFTRKDDQRKVIRISGSVAPVTL